ncbi:hypothetical protein MMC25_005423 [Agyrium rufum]|nr:hypothetical protein [Agyrium rufum]
MYCGDTAEDITYSYQNLITTGSMADAPSASASSSSTSSSSTSSNSSSRSASSSSSSSSSSPSSASSTHSVLAQNTTVPSVAASDDRSTLSTGTIAGVAVGGATALGALAFAIYWFCGRHASRSRRLHRAHVATKRSQIPRGTLGGAVLPGSVSPNEKNRKTWFWSRDAGKEESENEGYEHVGPYGGSETGKSYAVGESHHYSPDVVGNVFPSSELEAVDVLPYVEGGGLRQAQRPKGLGLMDEMNGSKSSLRHIHDDNEPRLIAVDRISCRPASEMPTTEDSPHSAYDTSSRNHPNILRPGYTPYRHGRSTSDSSPLSTQSSPSLATRRDINSQLVSPMSTPRSGTLAGEGSDCGKELRTSRALSARGNERPYLSPEIAAAGGWTNRSPPRLGTVDDPERVNGNGADPNGGGNAISFIRTKEEGNREGEKYIADWTVH